MPYLRNLYLGPFKKNLVLGCRTPVGQKLREEKDFEEMLI
jgi:hypothetical protein